MRAMLTLALLTLLLTARGAMTQSSFSCSFGEPACLDYGAVVCKNSARCVERDAVCFDSYTCDYNGFVCKSSLISAVSDYETLRSTYNNLVDTHNQSLIDLKNKSDEMESANASLLFTRNERDEAVSKLQRYKECVDKSSTIDEAKSCD